MSYSACKRMVPALLGLILAGTSQPACRSSDEQSGPMPQPSKAPPVGFEVDTGKRVAVADKPLRPQLATKTGMSKTPARPALSDKTLALLRKAMPRISGARTLEPLAVLPHSRLARTVLCVESPVAQATSRILRSYRADKWSDITVHTPPHDPDRRTFTGNSKRFRVNGSASQSKFDDCEKSRGHTRVSLSFQERPLSTKPSDKKNGRSAAPGLSSTRSSNPLLPKKKKKKLR